MNKNISIIYYTANKIPDSFADTVRKQLLKSADGIQIISVSQKPIDFGYNICVNGFKQSQLNIYRQATIGVKNAETENIALCEDDVLYHKDHFNYEPKNNIFAYDKNIWNIYTWVKPPVFSWKGRRNLYGLICNRKLFIKVMEERFAKYNEDNFPECFFGEPGRYEKQLGVKVNKSEFYYPKQPSIAFSHPTALSYLNLGKRKRLGLNKTKELSPWGTAEEVLALYK